MAYQSFPWQQGDSRSLEKLAALYLPALKGKSVLDAGCNTGFFCGWAAFQKASRVKGIDANQAFISQAAALFPECSFACMSWDDLGPEKYDVILCISAIHYARDQQALIDKLMERLTPGGVLVLEIGCAPGREDEFVAVQRSMDTRFFPTVKKINAMLAPYTFKYIGPSVQQTGDPAPRRVYHAYHARPYAVTFLDGHYTGKTSTAAALIRSDIRRISGDAVYHEIAGGTRPVDPPLRDVITFVPQTRHMDSATVTQTICERGLLPDLLETFLAMADGKDFLLDHYLPPRFRETAHALLHAKGYFVVNVSLHEAANPPWTRIRPPYKQYAAYMRHLEERHAINEQDYLEANPDVARAVAQGKLPSGRFHYLYFGKKEKRKLRPDQE